MTDFLYRRFAGENLGSLSQDSVDVLEALDIISADQAATARLNNEGSQAYQQRESNAFSLASMEAMRNSYRSPAQQKLDRAKAIAAEVRERRGWNVKKGSTPG